MFTAQEQCPYIHLTLLEHNSAVSMPCLLYNASSMHQSIGDDDEHDQMITSIILAPRDHCNVYGRMQLPDALPPTFKGSAVRCSYQLEAKAIFAAQSWKGSTPSSSAPSTEFQSQQSQASTPSTDSPAQRGHALPPTNSSPHLMKYSSSSNVKLSRGREAVGQQQRKGPGIVHVKTPVHLWPAVSIQCDRQCNHHWITVCNIFACC